MDPQETKIFMVAVIVTIIVGVALLYLFILLYKQQRKNLILQRKIAIAEISSLEEERSRIAADLHDDLGPLLSAIKFRINSLGADAEGDREEIETSTQLLDDAIIRLRQVSNNLLPTSLVRKGLIEAMQEMANIYSLRGNLKIDLEYTPDIYIPKEKQIHLFRMSQEGILNCIKHAGATRLLIVLKKEGNRLCLSITDNGSGMIRNKTAALEGRGLISLSNRANILGGFLEIHSEENKGTILNFEIPV